MKRQVKAADQVCDRASAKIKRRLQLRQGQQGEGKETDLLERVKEEDGKIGTKG